MHGQVRSRRWFAGLGAIVAVCVAALLVPLRGDTGDGQTGRAATATATRTDFVRSVRLSGTVEAVQATTISTPRLAGQNSSSLVITHLVRPGSQVHQGDLIVEFDRQDQLKNALDRQVELNDLEQQIRKKKAENAAARARDDSELLQAQSALTRAELEMAKNEMLPRIQAEKNTQALEEAGARLAQLKTTYELKRRAAAADLHILEIRRDRAENAMRQAETNAEKMAVTAPIEGMAVLRTIWKSNNMAEVQEGEEVRSGMPIVDVVNPSAMRVRARINQADAGDVRVGQPVRIGLDAYPELAFDGRVVQLSPLAVTSSMSPKVRTFVALVAIDGSHPKLMPDLTASVDVEIGRENAALVVPRDALATRGEDQIVRVRRGETFEDRRVVVGAMNNYQAVIVSGLEEGAVVARHVNGAARR